MSFPRKCVPLLAAAAAVAAVAAAPAAAQHPKIDQRVYTSDVPAGQLEHGVISFTISGTAAEQRADRIEYWATSNRFRIRTTDARTGALRRESIYDGRETVDYVTKPKMISRFKGNESFPGPGWPSAYNRKLLDCGMFEQLGERTIAGLSGVVFHVKQDAKTTEPGAECKWSTDNPAAQTELVFEAGTLRPLQRTHTADIDGKSFRQDEVLVSRESAPVTSASMARLSKAAKRSALKAWKAKGAKIVR